MKTEMQINPIYAFSQKINLKSSADVPLSLSFLILVDYSSFFLDYYT
jgi:hypothetical protein